MSASSCSPPDRRESTPAGRARHGFSVTEACKNKDAAASLVLWLTNDDSQKIEAAHGALPTRTAVWEWDIEQAANDPYKKEVLTAFQEAAKYAFAGPADRRMDRDLERRLSRAAGRDRRRQDAEGGARRRGRQGDEDPAGRRQDLTGRSWPWRRGAGAPPPSVPPAMTSAATPCRRAGQSHPRPMRSLGASARRFCCCCRRSSSSSRRSPRRCSSRSIRASPPIRLTRPETLWTLRRLAQLRERLLRPGLLAGVRTHRAAADRRAQSRNAVRPRARAARRKGDARPAAAAHA